MANRGSDVLQSDFEAGHDHGAAPKWLRECRHEREVRMRAQESDSRRSEFYLRRSGALESSIKASTYNEFYVPKTHGPPSKEDHNPGGAKDMLMHILNELGPEFFSDDMKLSPEAKAKVDSMPMILDLILDSDPDPDTRKLDWENFLKLKDAVIYGDIDKIPKLIRNGASQYTIEEPATGKTLMHMAARRNQEAVIRKLHYLRSKKFPNPCLAVDVENKNAIHDAAEKGNIGPIRALTQCKADINNQVHCCE